MGQMNQKSQNGLKRAILTKNGPPKMDLQKWTKNGPKFDQNGHKWMDQTLTKMDMN